MESVLVAAYTQLLKAHPNACSVDRILEHPNLRTQFLELVRTSAVERPEFDVLHTLNNLRKRSKLPRRSD
ncbi:hypothetical protein [Frigoriglobus tundricola]|uniref:Uncharacterized protein n=1 Tax=Frigoriglobus tundricola TaxID=2774151 RepID=A0A6M5YLI6_9BACT|nr:hypothetical protein [Frigoriglobus tundricola]QJW94163.1 hypothetical protein FTUN_1682 [Frigoriglobus tundricola]